MRRAAFITLAAALAVTAGVLGSLALRGETNSVSGAADNQMAVDADASTQPVDSAVTIAIGQEFDVSVNITAAPTPYAGFEAYVEFDGNVIGPVLTFVPVPPLNVVYPGLGGMNLDALAVVQDRDGDTLPEVASGSSRISGTAIEIGQAVVVRFRCERAGTSDLHLLTAIENPPIYTTTMGVGGVPIATSLTDASVTCEEPPTPTPTQTLEPTPTNTPTPTPVPPVMSVDMEPRKEGVQSTTTIDLDTVSGFGDAVSDFDIDLFVKNIPAAGLGSFSFDLVYDDSRVDATAVLEGPFLASGGASTSCSVQNPDVDPGTGPGLGRARLTCNITSGDAPQGSGVLGSVEFDILPTPGGDWLSFQLEATSLVDAGLTPLSHTTQDGSGDVIGVIGTLAGSAGNGGFDGDGDEAQDALLHDPHGLMEVAATDTLYFADTENNRIRRIYPAQPTGTIMTVAGSDDPRPYCGDGEPATDACLNHPHDVFVDNAGNLYIADTDNHRIRKVDMLGTITTVAGTGYATGSIDGPGGDSRDDLGDGGQALDASLNGPRGVAVDDSGNIYVADTENHRIRRVDAVSGVITTVAGNGTPGFSGDGGPAAAANLDRPHDVYMYETSGSFIIADTDNNRIRLVDGSSGNILTLAGSGLASFGGDGDLATLAHLNGPEAVAVDSADARLPDILIADTQNHRIRRVDGGSTIIITVAGNGTQGSSGDGGPATQAQLNFPAGITFGSTTASDTQNDTLRVVDPTTGEPGGRFAGMQCTVGSIGTTDWVLLVGVLGLILARRQIRGLILQVRLLARRAARPGTTSWGRREPLGCVRFSLPARLAALTVVGLVVAWAFVPWDSPTALADPSSIAWEVMLDETSGTSSGNGDGIVQVDESPDTVAVISLDTTAPPPTDEPFFDMTNTVFTGLAPAFGVAVTDGAWVGTMTFSVESNLMAPGASNVSSSTGQPPICAAGTLALGDELDLFDADLGTGTDADVGLGPGRISERDLDGGGLRETEEDNFLADGSPGSNGLADGIDLLPDALAGYIIPSLGLGPVIGRSFGVADIAAVGGRLVTQDVNLLLFRLDGGEYLTLTILGYPGPPRQQPSGANLTDQTVITCPPFSSTVRLFGVTQDNPTTGTGGGVAQRTATEGTHDFKVLVSSRDNYDGDAAASAYDSCPDTTSVDTDLPPHPIGETDPGEVFGDRWDSSCDVAPATSDNDGDTQVSYYVPGTGDWALDAENCNQPYITSGGGWDCDQDVDGDTTLNTVDNCPTVPDADVLGMGKEDGSGPVEVPGTGDCNDGMDNDDGDGLADMDDPQCWPFVNWQLDSDADTVGDVCDEQSPRVKGSGLGYAVDRHPHGFPGEPGGYGDHDLICNDQFTVPGTEGSGDASCVPTVDSGNDGDPDFLDENGNAVYNIGEPIDTDSDADGDGHTDACEAFSGSDPLDRSSVPRASSTSEDCDGDGSLDENEEAEGSNPFPCLDREGDGQCGDPVNDWDDDGCADVQETALGNTFSPIAWYDVYDVPVPAKADAVGANGSRNRVVDIGDVLAVLFYAFADAGGPPNANGVSYDSVKGWDGNGDSVNDASPVLDIPEGQKYDRSPGQGPSGDTGIDPAGAPNGAIDIGDVLAALAQAFVVDCSGGP